MRWLPVVFLCAGCGPGIHATSTFTGVEGSGGAPAEEVDVLGTTPARPHVVVGRLRVTTEPTRFVEDAMRSARNELERRGQAEGCDAVQLIASPRTPSCDGAEVLVYDALCLKWRSP